MIRFWSLCIIAGATACGSVSSQPGADLGGGGSGSGSDIAFADLAGGGGSPDLAMPSSTALSCTSTSPCWDNCSQHGTLSSCVSQCGVGDGVSCWKMCINHGDALSTCVSYCGADPGCKAALCWESCGGHGDALSTCLSYCGKDKTPCSRCSPVRSAWDQCWALCTAHGDPTSTCQSYCGS